MRSVVIGLRLCGIALEPFCCPERNGSSASRTSVRWRWRISVASRSRPAPASAIACSSSAWRSRGTTWVETGSRASPSRASTRASKSGLGGRVGPDGAADRADATPARTRARGARRCGAASNAKPASLMPNVVGSAWTPCVRPTQTVSTCSRARSASADDELARARDDDLARGAQLQGERRVEHVGRRQAEVDPAPGGAGARAEHVDERRDVVVGDALALLDRLDGERRGADRLEVVARSGPSISSQAATSTRRHASMRASSVQRAPISGRV